MLRWLAVHFLVVCFLFFCFGIVKVTAYKDGRASKKCTFAVCTKHVIAYETRK